jgi:hypothetical protein
MQLDKATWRAANAKACSSDGKLCDVARFAESVDSDWADDVCSALQGTTLECTRDSGDSSLAYAPYTYTNSQGRKCFKMAGGYSKARARTIDVAAK